jgi:hypothetical protein
MDVNADDPRFAGIHRDALKNIRPGAKYISSGRRSYDIRQDGQGYWYIVPYTGPLIKSLRGKYTSFKDVERALIQFLRSKDKFGRAWYPGSPASEKYDKSNS